MLVKVASFIPPRAITQFITDILNPQLGEKILDPACGTGGYLTCAIEHLKKQAKNVNERKSIEQNISGWEYKPLPYLLATTNLILHDIEIPNIKFGDALDQPLSNQLGFFILFENYDDNCRCFRTLSESGFARFKDFQDSSVVGVPTNYYSICEDTNRGRIYLFHVRHVKKRITNPFSI